MSENAPVRLCSLTIAHFSCIHRGRRTSNGTRFCGAGSDAHGLCKHKDLNGRNHRLQGIEPEGIEKGVELDSSMKYLKAVQPDLVTVMVVRREQIRRNAAAKREEHAGA